MILGDPHVMPATAKMKALYGKKVIGSFKGKPIVPGVAGKGQGDFDLMVHKMVTHKGMSEASAKKIAGRAYQNKYGK